MRKMFLRLFTALLPVTLFPALHMAGRDGGRNMGSVDLHENRRFGWILSDISWVKNGMQLLEVTKK